MEEAWHTKDAGKPREQSRVECVGGTVYFISFAVLRLQCIILSLFVRLQQEPLDTSRGWRAAICHPFHPGLSLLTYLLVGQ